MCQCRWEWCLEPYPGRLEAWVYGTHPLIHGPMQIKKVNFDLVFRNKSSPQNSHNLHKRIFTCLIDLSNCWTEDPNLTRILLLFHHFNADEKNNFSFCWFSQIWKTVDLILHSSSTFCSFGDKRIGFGVRCSYKDEKAIDVFAIVDNQSFNMHAKNNRHNTCDQ